MKVPEIPGFGLLILSLFVGSLANASNTIKLKDGPLDQITLHTGTIDRDAPIHIHLFDTKGVKLGKAKHQDTARLMAGTAPHLLAVDIVESLRDHGFSNVILEESARGAKGYETGELSLEGRFSELNPGSQAARAWIGFGAGKSKVCVKGELRESGGKSLGEFADCRSGLGWGKSTGEIENSTQSIGDHIANMLISWSNGEYSR